jgi:hypothetical protein
MSFFSLGIPPSLDDHTNSGTDASDLDASQIITPGRAGREATWHGIRSAAGGSGDAESAGKDLGCKEREKAGRRAGLLAQRGPVLNEKPSLRFVPAI